MNAKIDEDGDLLIRRAGDWVPQFCPFQASAVRCGHTCPLFGELVEDENAFSKIYTLQLCHGKIRATFIDERIAP